MNYNDSEPVLGVLGGMGPLATTKFMEWVIERTPASEDQDHVQMVVLNDPTVPDRMAAILENGENPVPKLRTNARRLEQSGVNIIAVPCNTFHYFYDDVASAVDVPIPHMIQETVNQLARQGTTTTGILATSGTRRTGIYQDILHDHKIESIEPEDPDAVMDAIYGIKRGETERPREVLESSYESLLDAGAQSVIAGCTEIPIVLEGLPKLVDPMDILAQRCVTAIKRSETNLE